MNPDDGAISVSEINGHGIKSSSGALQWSRCCSQLMAILDGKWTSICWRIQDLPLLVHSDFGLKNPLDYLSDFCSKDGKWIMC